MSDNSREIVRRALAGLGPPRPATGPLAVHYCARFAGVSLRQYTLDAATLADCVVRYYQEFHPDAVWLSADTWVTAEAMGAAVGFAGEDQPMGGIGQALIQSPGDIAAIPSPDARSQGRFPLMLEALDRIRQSIGNEAYIVACFDQYPLSLACALMGIDRAMVALTDDRTTVELLMPRCEEYALAYAVALAEAGADMLSGGDSPAGLIGPLLYDEVALPAERRLIQAIKSAVSVPVSLHICGDARPILPGMARSGADVLELDWQVDIADACTMLGPDIALWGNLDPVGVLAHGNVAQVTRATCQLLDDFDSCGHQRFVASSGCTLAVETPAENLEAMLRAVRCHGESDGPGA